MMRRCWVNFQWPVALAVGGGGLDIFLSSIISLFFQPGRVAQSVGRLTRKSGPGFDTRSGNMLSFLLPLFQEGQISVTGEIMCTKYWLTA